MPTTTVATSNFDIDEPSSAVADADDSVTVLIAAYNAGAFLHRAIRPAQDQTKPLLEILVVDDGSVDDTAVVAQRLGLEDRRIRLVVLKKNSGPAKARNAASRQHERHGMPSSTPQGIVVFGRRSLQYL